MKQDDKVYDRLWARIGLFEVWDRPMLAFSVCVTALLSYAFDAVRLGNYSLGWIPVNAIALAVAVALVLVTVKIARSRDLAPQDRSVLNLVLAAVAMGTKNVVTLALCPVFGIDDSGSWLFRFVGGATIGVSILLIYSNLRGAKIERLLIANELLAKEQALRGFRENITDIFAKEQQELTDRTTAEILPRLIQLQEKVQLGQTGTTLTKEFERVLTDEVRPLSAALAKEAATLKLTIPTSANIKPSKLHVRINLSQSIRPFSTGLLVFFAWWMLAQIVIPAATFMDVVIATVIFQLVLLGIKLLVIKIKKATVNQALAFAAIPGTVASIPSYYLFYQIPHEVSQQNLLPTFLVTGAWACLSFSLAYILDRGRAEAEYRLTELVNQFTKENKLFEQKLWVAQHVWYTLLHGSVQSALTAAAIRTASKAELSEKDQEAILQDLNRAISALKNPAIADVDLEKSRQELQQTWAGICEIDVEVQAEASKVLEAQPDARLVTNEVLKEAISNAVKHAQASEAAINLSLNPDGDISITVISNGQEPKANSGSGIGTKIFESVCLSYRLSRDEKSAQTIFQAVVPVA